MIATNYANLSLQVKKKWQAIEKKITKVALNRQTVSQMENDMERWLKERERLSHKLERMRVKRRRLILEKGAGTKVVEDLDDQVRFRDSGNSIGWCMEKCLNGSGQKRSLGILIGWCLNKCL